VQVFKQFNPALSNSASVRITLQPVNSPPSFDSNYIFRIAEPSGVTPAAPVNFGSLMPALLDRNPVGSSFSSLGATPANPIRYTSIAPFNNCTYPQGNPSTFNLQRSYGTNNNQANGTFIFDVANPGTTAPSLRMIGMPQPYVAAGNTWASYTPFAYAGDIARTIFPLCLRVNDSLGAYSYSAVTVVIDANTVGVANGIIISVSLMVFLVAVVD
jgi:hypothetical protein